MCILICTLIYKLKIKFRRRKKYMTKDPSRKYAVIASICFAILAVYSCVKTLLHSIDEAEYISITFLSIAYWVILLFFAITLLLAKKNIAFVIVTGANLLLNVYYLISYACLSNVIDFLSAAALTVMAVIVCLPSMSSMGSIVKKLCLLPAALCISCNLIDQFSYEYYSYQGEAGFYVITSFLNVAAYLFTGLWLASNTTARAKAVPQKDEFKAFAPEHISVPTYNTATNDSDEADRLKIYRELLDTGFITRDEFEQKKRQLRER